MRKVVAAMVGPHLVVAQRIKGRRKRRKGGERLISAAGGVTKLGVLHQVARQKDRVEAALPQDGKYPVGGGAVQVCHDGKGVFGGDASGVDGVFGHGHINDPFGELRLLSVFFCEEGRKGLPYR